MDLTMDSPRTILPLSYRPLYSLKSPFSSLRLQPLFSISSGSLPDRSFTRYWSFIDAKPIICEIKILNKWIELHSSPTFRMAVVFAIRLSALLFFIWVELLAIPLSLCRSSARSWILLLMPICQKRSGDKKSIRGEAGPSRDRAIRE